MAGIEISNGSHNWLTDASPWLSLARIARLVGSARAENVELSGSDIYLTFLLFNMLVKYNTSLCCVNGLGPNLAISGNGPYLQGATLAHLTQSLLRQGCVVRPRGLF